MEQVEKIAEEIDSSENEEVKNKRPIDFAQDNYNHIVELKQTIGSVSFLMGKLLVENKRNGYYKLLGHNTFESFLGSSEISFHRTTAYKYMKVYSEFIEYYKLGQQDLQDIDLDKLYLILPIIDKNNVQEWVEKARTLSRSDLRVAIQGKKQKRMVELGSEWIEYADVWEKTQPVSRWGKNPKQTIYGQFVANLVNYYTKEKEKVSSNIPDTVVKDVANEFNREFSEIKEGADYTQIDDMEAELGISMTPNLSIVLQQYMPTTINMFRKMVKKGGRIAFYIKQSDIDETTYTEFVSTIEALSFEEFYPERLIVIRERPDVKKVNEAIKDESLGHSFERIVIFKRNDGQNN